MKVSVQIHNDNTSWKTYKAIAQTVDRGRWHTLWNYDHLVPPTAELMPHITEDLRAFEEGDTFEGYSMLSAFAALTERVRIGCLVTAIPFRNPALLAKMAVTIDHISDGRFDLGLGAAWHTSEARAYGIALGGNKEKLDRFGEALEVIRLLLTPGGRRNFDGQYFKLDDAPFAPLPVQKKLPILIGGGGEKRTLRYVAQYADHYNFFGNVFSSREVFERKSQLLDEHCAAIGRDPKEIGRSVALWADIVPDAAAARAKREFIARPLGQEAQDGVLFGTPEQIVEGTRKVIDGLQVDEVIYCGLTPHAEIFQQFDEEVLRHLTTAAAVV